jgi:MFS family permease
MDSKKLALFLQIIIFVAFIGMTLPYPLIAPLFLSKTSPTYYFLFDFNISNKSFVSILLGIYPFGLFVGGLLLGMLTDRFSKKKILMLCLFFAAISQCVSGILITYKQFEWLLISRFFSGIFEGNIAIARALLAIISNNTQLKVKHFGRANAALTLGWAIGPLLGAIISKIFTTSNLKYNIPFFLSSTISLLLFISVFLLFKDLDPSHKAIQSNSSSSNNSTKKNIIYFLATSLVITLGVDAFYQFLPIFLTLHFSFSVAYIGVGVATVSFFNVLTNIFINPLLGKVAEAKKIIIWSIIFLAIFLVLFSINNLTFIAFIISAFIGISIYTTYRI